MPLGLFLLAQRRLNNLLQFLFPERCADEELLAGSCAQANRFPAICGWHSYANHRNAFRIANRPDDSGNDGPDFGMIAKQLFEHGAQSVDNAVFNLELALSGSKPHAGPYERQYTE